MDENDVGWVGGYLQDKGWRWQNDDIDLHKYMGCYRWDRNVNTQLKDDDSYEDVLEECADYCSPLLRTNDVLIGIMKRLHCICLTETSFSGMREVASGPCNKEKHVTVWYYEIGIFTDSYHKKGCYEAINFVKIPDNSVQLCQLNCRGQHDFALQGDRCICLENEDSEIKITKVPNENCRGKCPGNPSTFCGNISEHTISVYHKTSDVSWTKGHPVDGRYCSSVDVSEPNFLLSENCSSSRSFTCKNRSVNKEGMNYSWFDAIKLCRSIGGQLDIPSKNPSNHLNNQRYWTELRREATWIWNDGSSVTQTVYDDISGDHTNDKNCLSLRKSKDTFGLAASDCQIKRSIICEFYVETKGTNSTAPSVSEIYNTSISTVFVAPFTEEPEHSSVTGSPEQTIEPSKKGGFGKEETENTNDKGIYIGIGIGVPVLILLVVCVLIVYWRRKMKKECIREERVVSILYENMPLRMEDMTSPRPSDQHKPSSEPTTLPGSVHNDTYGRDIMIDDLLWASNNSYDRRTSEANTSQISVEYSIPMKNCQRGMQAETKRENDIEYSSVYSSQGNACHDIMMPGAPSPSALPADTPYDKLGAMKSSGDVADSSNLYDHTQTDDEMYEIQSTVRQLPFDPDYSNMGK